MPAQLSAPRRVNPCTFSLACRCPMQNGSLPLQLALRNGESIEVVAALLAAHPQAEAEVDSAEHRGMLERAKAHGQSSAITAALPAAGSSTVRIEPTAPSLIAALRAQKPDNEVLPLINEAAAKRKEEDVRRTCAASYLCVLLH